MILLFSRSLNPPGSEKTPPRRQQKILLAKVSTSSSYDPPKIYVTPLVDPTVFFKGEMAHVLVAAAALLSTWGAHGLNLPATHGRGYFCAERVAFSRREVLGVAPPSLLFFLQSSPAVARAPGSVDLSASVSQIHDASATLKNLRANWKVKGTLTTIVFSYRLFLFSYYLYLMAKDYTFIDAEGRAGDIDSARRILGGISPQNQPAASPLYKVTLYTHFGINL